MQVEPKAFSQKKPDQLVYLELGAGNGGMLLSISEDGFRFRAVTPLRGDGEIPFAFILDGTRRFEGSGAIEWIDEEGKCGGLRFTEVSPAFRAELSRWLSSDSHHPSSREVTPARATPVDTMEQIRQELRSAYPTRPPVEPGLKDTASAPESDGATASHSWRPPFSELETEPRIAPRMEIQAKPGPKAEPRPRVEAKPEAIPQNKPKLSEPQISSRWAPSSAKPEEQALGPSAFLRQRAQFPPVAEQFVVPPSGSPATVSPTKPDVPVAPASSSMPAQPRPYVPPLEESFESAWERAKLHAPPNSSHVSRAAAGSIVAIALAAILGTLAYNFRQDIGVVFIQFGQSISGQTDSAPPAVVPAPSPVQESKPEGQPSEEQSLAQKSPVGTPPQEASAESSKTANPSATSANPNLAAGGAPVAANAKSASVPAVENLGTSSAPSAAKSNGNAGHPSVIETLPKSEAGVESETGQDEFNAARDLLRGKNRQQELSKAVDLLWAGVRKGYVPAEVTLADMFRRGDGVEKNCDQARVLLVAASKKGSADARQMLEKMAEQGCD